MKKGVAYFLLCAGTIFAPSIFNLQTIAFVFPYFVLGISYGKINKQLNVSNKVFWFAAVGYLLLIILWKKECYIYISGMSVLFAENIADQMIIIVYRFLVGMLGSVAIIGVLERIENKIGDELKRKITLVGSKTGTIYLLSTILFLYSVKILEKISPNLFGGNGFFSVLIDLLILFPISILVILICIKAETRLFRHTAINKFLFGRW